MDSTVEILLDRSQNELLTAGALLRLSEDASAKEEFAIPAKLTFYSGVISHAYYAVFYAAQASLLTRGIRTQAPEVHRKTLEAFEEHLVKTGILDIQLLKIYKKMTVRADELLEIFREEKSKRGRFTYSTIPQANREPANDSLANARKFVANIAQTIRA